MAENQPLKKLEPSPGYPEFDLTRKDFKGFGDLSPMKQSANGTVEFPNAANVRSQGKKKSAGLYAGIGAVAVIVIAAIVYFGVTASLKSSLTSETWSRYEDGSSLYLDFYDDQVEYSMYGSYIGRMTIANLDYKVISPNTIQVKYGDSWRSIHVDIDDGTLEFEPALTSTESYEFWY